MDGNGLTAGNIRWVCLLSGGKNFRVFQICTVALPRSHKDTRNEKKLYTDYINEIYQL